MSIVDLQVLSIPDVCMIFVIVCINYNIGSAIDLKIHILCKVAGILYTSVLVQNMLSVNRQAASIPV